MPPNVRCPTGLAGTDLVLVWFGGGIPGDPGEDLRVMLKYARGGERRGGVGGGV